MPSLRGHFLIASPTLKDPNFAESVVLMVRHDDEGAMGVIINAPLDVTVADALAESVKSAADVTAPLHRGGPCQGPMMVLHTSGGDQSDEVMHGLWFTASRDDIESVMGAEDGQPARYIIGYAGWATDQLEQELAEGSWVVVPATPTDVFADVKDLWGKLMSKANLMKFIKPDEIPQDPEMN